MRMRFPMVAGGVALLALVSARGVAAQLDWEEINWGEITPWEQPVEAPVRLLPEVAVDLGLERDALVARKAELDEQEARLALASRALDGQIANLDKLKTELTEILGLADKNLNGDIERLVQIYRSMKPAQAGGILNDMDIEVATLVIAAMNEKDAGPIMANMRPVRAQAISKIIFERSKLPGDQRLISVRID